MACRAFVFQSRPGDFYRVGRTLRSLHGGGIAAESVGFLDRSTLQRLLAEPTEVLLVRAGAWLANPGTLRLPIPSATGRGTCAIGCLRRPTPSANAPAHPEFERWKVLFARTGGDFTRAKEASLEFPEILCIHLDAPAVLASQTFESLSLASWIRGRPDTSLRVVHFPPLDVYDDEGLRVHQVITALHRGGAERLTLDLLEVLPELGVSCRLATLGRALRTSFPVPLDTLELGLIPGTTEDRMLRLRKRTLAFGTDLFHAHLLSQEQLRTLAGLDVPILATLHNAQAGWPPGTAMLSPSEASLLAACSQGVEAEARAASLAPALRTVWNGIRTDLFRKTPERILGGRRLRDLWEIGPDDFVLLSLANFRPQKRLEKLPRILECTRQILASSPPFEPHSIRLLIAGESLRDDEESRALEEDLKNEFRRLGLDDAVRWLGSMVDVPALLAAADVLVSVGAHEGLSLAHLEALAMGCPVVATQVGGAPEVARDHPGLRLVPADAPPERVAEQIASARIALRECERPARVDDLPKRSGAAVPIPPEAEDSRLASFTTHRMACRYRWLYRRAMAHASHLAKPSGQGLWLVTNHLATGGAQSSARRLLLTLKGRGMRVGAAVVQEHPHRPSPGRAELLAAGIPVVAIPPMPDSDPEAAIESLLEVLDVDPPAAVFLWNLIPIYKVLLADALCQVPVHDVSPGEMLFESLDRYFAHPSPGLPYRSPRDYGARLAGCVVKYAAEADRARDVLDVPVHVIPNGVSIDHFPPAAFHQGPKSPPTLRLGTLARLNPHKRLEDLFAALRIAHPQLPPWRLEIAGGVEAGFEAYAETLKTSATDLPIDWLGDVPDVRPCLQRWDLFCMISEPAGCPNAILEAMATGLPVVATAVGGATEQIQHGESGWLVPPRDPNLMASALVQLAQDRPLRISLGTAARSRIERHFSIDLMADRYQRLIVATECPSRSPSQARQIP